MGHQRLLIGMIGLLVVAAGGVFVLVNQGGSQQEITEETLMASVSADAPEQSLSPVQPTLAPPPSNPDPAPQPSPVPIPAPLGKININTANLEELEQITGVGPVIAQRIIDYRSEHGSFQSIEEIKSVKGIGDAMFEKMRDEITV